MKNHLPDKPIPLSRWVAQRRQQLSARLFVLNERSRRITSHLNLDEISQEEATLAGTSELLKRMLSAEKHVRQTLVDHPAAVLIVDEHRIVQLINNAARELLHRQGVDPTFTSSAGHIDDLFPGALSSNQIEIGHGDDPDKEHLSLVVKRSPVIWGRRKATLVLLYDVTPQVEARRELETAVEQLREVNQLKSEFITLASHEFRTPLTSVLSSLELLGEYVSRAEDALPGSTVSRMRKHLDRSQASVQRLDDMVGEMLVLEKYTAGQIECRPEPVDLAGLVREIFRTLDPVAEQHEVELRLADDGLKGRGQWQLDPRLVRHILTNLISNAVRYSTSGGSVTVVLQCSGSDTVDIRVRDTGIGIPADEQNRVFDTFFRGSNSRHADGTGLGLSIVKRFIALHRGSISFDSEVGRGTEFRVRLPDSQSNGSSTHVQDDSGD